MWKHWWIGYIKLSTSSVSLARTEVLNLRSQIQAFSRWSSAWACERAKLWWISKREAIRRGINIWLQLYSHESWVVEVISRSFFQGRHHRLEFIHLINKQIIYSCLWERYACFTAYLHWRQQGEGQRYLCNDAFIDISIVPENQNIYIPLVTL